MKNDKIAIFGATGRVGSGVVLQLLNQGFSVLAIGRSPEKLADLEAMGAQTLATSFDQKTQIEQALKGYDLVMTLVPSNHTADDFFADQLVSIDAQINAIKKNRIKRVVNLSSVSAHLPEGIGILNALHGMELTLNELEDVKVVHLRPAYYMENGFYSLPLIHTKGINGLAAKGMHAFPMVAIQDVIPKVVQAIVEFDSYSDETILPILGPRDYTLQEFTQILGQSIDQPDLPYIEFTDEEMKAGLLQAGTGTESFIDLYIELSRSWERGACNCEVRTIANTTSTTAEQFAKEIFRPAYHGFVAQFAI